MGLHWWYHNLFAVLALVNGMCGAQLWLTYLSCDTNNVMSKNHLAQFGFWLDAKWCQMIFRHYNTCVTTYCRPIFCCDIVWFDKNRVITLLWRHNGHDSVWNHQPYDCLLNHLFRRRPKTTSKLHVTGLCAGNSLANSLHKGPVTRKMFPFDDVIMLKKKYRRSRYHTHNKNTWSRIRFSYPHRISSKWLLKHLTCDIGFIFIKRMPLENIMHGLITEHKI